MDEDKYKQIRDEMLDEPIEEKLIDNLHGSMLYFVFDHLCSLISEEENTPRLETHKQFFKEWKQFANSEIIKNDLQIINNELNSDSNIFTNILIGDATMSESTEIYQQKYYEILNKVEKNFFENFKERNHE